MFQLLDSKRGPVLSIALGALAGVAYGALARITFSNSTIGGVFGTVSAAFHRN